MCRGFRCLRIGCCPCFARPCIAGASCWRRVVPNTAAITPGVSEHGASFGRQRAVIEQAPPPFPEAQNPPVTVTARNVSMPLFTSTRSVPWPLIVSPPGSAVASIVAAPLTARTFRGAAGQRNGLAAQAGAELIASAPAVSASRNEPAPVSAALVTI